MHCERCGRAHGEADRFCAGCGAVLPAPVEPLTAAEPVPEATGGAPASSSASEAPAAAAGWTPPPPPPAAWSARAPEPAVARPAPAPAYAGFWRRFFAMVLDGFVLFFPQAILRVAMGLPALSYEDEWGDRTVVTAEILGLALTFLYCATLEASGAQGSLGQQAFGLAVTDLHGGRIGFGRALTRQFAKIVSSLLCGMGYLFQLWNGKRQTLHDAMTGCLVVRRDESVARDSGGSFVVAS